MAHDMSTAMVQQADFSRMTYDDLLSFRRHLRGTLAMVELALQQHHLTRSEKERTR